MSDLVAHLDALTNASRVEELWALHCDRMATYGFDRLIYGFTRYRSGASLGDPQDWVLLTNHGDSYMDAFLGQGHLYNAPMIHWALENTGACSWMRLRDPAQLTEAERNVVAFNASQNVTAGYTVSFLSVSKRIKGAIALTARPGLTQSDVDAVWAEHGAEITIINNVLHLKLQTLPYSQRHLTRRQREVLQWVGDGKTNQDIALLLDVSPATVEKHLRLAREALDVETTAQAVLKAAFYNQMFVIDTAQSPRN
ncbi:LuxR family transcriptional regulator [Thalassorhabdomicrobium marinisediminis]|uniref:LuxR family transcriptional regulator n=1 Tax=Thalassorhabdomicrobium marinisediminis TaxID=2170577 RepID=A0A2T7G1R7_9RHOB|nr:LuxR family transcriptional regulator [Thalassorhabdomicrobium marinisediminis]PVA08357.1 LuxR family transcriptional regulator [Thalassorhabdomicrobium marinisediminis]